MARTVQDLQVAEARKALALPESADVMQLVTLAHVLKGAFSEVGVECSEVEAFIDEVSEGYKEDRLVAFSIPEPEFRTQLQRWSRLYLDSVKGSASLG